MLSLYFKRCFLANLVADLYWAGIPPKGRWKTNPALRQKAAQRKRHPKRVDFSDLVGKWTPDPAFDEIIASSARYIGISGSEGRPRYQPSHRPFQGDRDLAELLGTWEEVWIPLIVLAEIKAGFYGGSQQHHNESLLQTLLAKPTVRILLPGRETAEH